MSQDKLQANASEATEQLRESSKEELQIRLKKLEATATQQYALKNYFDAAEAFSEAVEVQDVLNGEMALENADLLYLYGRCLYHVGVSNSDVLGGKVAQQEEPKRKKRKIDQESSQALTGDAQLAVQRDEQDATLASNGLSASKPFFQFTGDENWTDSEEEDDGQEEGAPAEEEDDDLAIAYEILDSARILFTRKMESLGSGGTESQDKTELRSLKERLADTYDLQSEIKLENEQFKDAVNDAQQALTYKLQLYPQESGMVAEAHYKLSIALNFASLPVQSAEDGGSADNAMDEDMCKQAAEEMEKAIMSCQARIRKSEASLPNLEGGKLEAAKRDIADARDLVQDMKNRLVDLRNPVVAATSAVDELDGAASVKGLLGELLGQSKSEQMKTLAQATATANDLSGLVKHRKKPKTDQGNLTAEDKGKRKLEDAAGATNEHAKKVKFENGS